MVVLPVTVLQQEILLSRVFYRLPALSGWLWVYCSLHGHNLYHPSFPNCPTHHSVPYFPPFLSSSTPSPSTASLFAWPSFSSGPISSSGLISGSPCGGCFTPGQINLPPFLSI